MNDLQKYKELLRRTKILYGVKDIKRMIDKSEESIHFYKLDIGYKNQTLPQLLKGDSQ
jgi:hypothetical protein